MHTFYTKSVFYVFVYKKQSKNRVAVWEAALFLNALF